MWDSKGRVCVPMFKMSFPPQALHWKKVSPVRCTTLYYEYIRCTTISCPDLRLYTYMPFTLTFYIMTLCATCTYPPIERTKIFSRRSILPGNLLPERAVRVSFECTPLFPGCARVVVPPFTFARASTSTGNSWRSS